MAMPEIVRITISDGEGTVSFLGDLVTALRLVAGCSMGPRDLGELFLAADVYQPGLTRKLMAELMAFDKELIRSGPQFIRDAIRLARETGRPISQPFQVFDDVTAREAVEARGCEVVAINLRDREIRTSPGVKVPSSGEVRIGDDQLAPARTVTYVLPKPWSVTLLETPPAASQAEPE